MNKKYLFIGIAVILFGVLIGLLWYWQGLAGSSDILTPEERAWLNAHPNLRMAPDPSFPPLEFFSETGQYQGMIADYFDLIQLKLGYKFVLSRLGTWAEVLEQAKSRRIDIITAAQITPERQVYMLFTKPIVDIPNVIITRNEGATGELNLDTLKNKTVAITKGNALHEYIQNQYPDIKLKLVEQDLDALLDVSFRRADATVVNLAIASYYIEQQGITNLHVVGDSGKSNPLTIASRNDEPILNRILEKGLAAVTQPEREYIHRKWIAIQSKNAFNSEQFISAVVIGALTIFFFFSILLLWNNILQREVKQRTAQLNNELHERNEVEETLRKQSEYLYALNETTIGLLNRFDLNELLKDIVNRAAQLMGTEHGFIYLNEPNDKFIELKVGTGIYFNHVGFRLNHGEGISGKVWESGQSMIVDDLQTYEGRSLQFEDIRKIHAIAAFALKTREQVYGVIGLGYLDENKKLDTTEIEALERFAQLASLALENAHLYAALQYELQIRKSAEEDIRTLNANLEQHVRERTAQLEAANQELDSFSYSISHDLRAPLRTLDGFSHALLEDYENILDDEAKQHLKRIRLASQHMANLIDELLELSRLSRSQLNRSQIDLLQMGKEVFEELKMTHPERDVTLLIPPVLEAYADTFLMRVVLTNLLGNAWKFSSKRSHAIIEIGASLKNHLTTYYVTDNGAGFDMAYADKLFGAFQRLHSKEEFDGIGVGLAIVQRIIHRHGGKIWAESQVEQGASFYFTLESAPVAEFSENSSRVK